MAAVRVPRKLSELQDVDSAGIADGDALVWNAAAGQHEYESVAAAGGASSLTDLTDVTGQPGPGVAPVGDDSGNFPLVPVTTQADLDGVLTRVAATDWHNVGDPGEPPFQSRFRNIGDPWSPLRFRILANSTVRLQGTVMCDDATIADATWVNIFDLPAEAAPGYSLEFAILTNDNAMSKLFVWENGQVIWGGFTGLGPAVREPVSRLPLNGISWSTAVPTYPGA